MALALTSLTFNFNVFLQGISSHIQPWPLLVHYPHLLLFHHQDFKLQNSLGPQTLIPFLIPGTFFFTLIMDSRPFNVPIQIFRSVLVSRASFLA